MVRDDSNSTDVLRWTYTGVRPGVRPFTPVSVSESPVKNTPRAVLVSTTRTYSTESFETFPSAVLLDPLWLEFVRLSPFLWSLTQTLRRETLSLENFYRKSLRKSLRGSGYGPWAISWRPQSSPQDSSPTPLKYGLKRSRISWFGILWVSLWSYGPSVQTLFLSQFLVSVWEESCVLEKGGKLSRRRLHSRWVSTGETILQWRLCWSSLARS